MINPKISIIVPVYNAESYLNRCLDSILSQSFTDWECILIDDGSKDDSGRICDKYAENDYRILAFHKSNGGVSSARNLALEKVHGEWITFVDSDDYVLPSYLDNLIVHSGEADLICSGYRRFGESNISCQALDTRKYDINIYVGDIFEMSPIKKTYLGAISYPWGKLLKTDVIRRGNLHFNTKMKLSEDTCFMLQYLELINNVLVVKGGDYMYYVSNRTKSHLQMNIKELKTHIDEMTGVAERLGYKYKIDTQNYVGVMCSMYFDAFLNHIKTLDFKSVSHEYSELNNHDKYEIGLFTGNMPPLKSIVVKLAFFNRYMLYLMLRFFSNKI